MAPKLFITGGTGYIGGSVLDTIAKAHPEYDITALLRNEPEAFKKTYPNIAVVKGDYDSADILSREAAQADVVVHNGDSDHESSLKAIIDGLLKRSKPGYLLHLSGTGIVSDYRSETYLGKQNPKVWSDVKDHNEIASLPDEALHRNTEKILNEVIAQYSDKINVAIMCPPDIYGKGKGLAKTWSAFVPILVKQARELGGRVFYYGEGENTRSWVHIDDLMKLYLNVVESAVSGGEKAEWGKNGYYFASTQEHTQLSVIIAAAKALKKAGVIETEEPLQVSLAKLDTMFVIDKYPGLSRYLFASNSRTRAERAGKLFGYKGEAPDLLEAIEEDVLDAVKQI